MSSEFSYNAPQFYTNLAEVVALSEEEDDFFDAKEVKNDDKDTKLDTIYENKENVLCDIEEESLNDSFSKIKIKSKFEGIDLAIDCDRKSHPMLTRQDVTIMSPKLSLELRSRSVLKEVDSLVEQRPSLGRKRKAEDSSNHACVAKYLSLAERIYHFQRDTPPRFRGVSKKHSGFRFSTTLPPLPTATVPTTPRFLSEHRLRHCSEHCLTQEERELQEIEEAKQNFKPQHLNKKIFDPVKEVDREKHFTVPKPFNLTEQSHKKVEEIQEEPFVFKAKPIPQNIYNNCESRVFRRRLAVVMEENEDEVVNSKVRGFKEVTHVLPATKVKPFSFDERDKLRAIRKSEKIKKIIEEEKNAATFKAQPLPSYVSDFHNSSIMSAPSTSSYHKHDQDEVVLEFKARPATVLYKKPFQVKKSNKTTTKVLDLKLNTEVRAQNRQAFEEQKKENEKEWEIIEAEMVKKEEQKIKEDIAKLRKDIVHKPLPLPKNIRQMKTSSEELDQLESEEN